MDGVAMRLRRVLACKQKDGWWCALQLSLEQEAGQANRMHSEKGICCDAFLLQSLVWETVPKPTIPASFLGGIPGE